MRPATISESAKRIRDGVPASVAIPEFLDTFYWEQDAAKQMSMFTEEPPSTGSPRQHALMAAICEYLVKRYRLPGIPAWVSAPNRILPEPWFTTPPGNDDDGMREFLAFSSPAEFRHHNIFTEAEPLRRASQHGHR